jgi:putative ABC transport system ATP-binding protein
MPDSIMDTNGFACRVVDMKKEYVLKSETVRALRGVTFDVPEGDYVAIMGPSGSGKSTLLNMLGCLDKPTFGSLWLGSDDVATMDDDQLADIRSQRIGFVFQAYNLIQQLTVVENIQVPLFYQGKSLSKEQRSRSMEPQTWLDLVLV